MQLTSDRLKFTLTAVEDAFGADVDYAMLVKHYGNEPEGEKRYSPAICTGATKRAVTGNPDSQHISTSFVARHNLTIRMQMRRYTRLTNGFPKKLSNHVAAFSLFVMYYNFGRPSNASRPASDGSRRQRSRLDHRRNGRPARKGGSEAAPQAQTLREESKRINPNRTIIYDTSASSSFSKSV